MRFEMRDKIKTKERKIIRTEYDTKGEWIEGTA